MSDIYHVQAGKLHRPDGGLVCAVGPRTGWLDWLEDQRHTSFRYEDATGRSCTVIKEARRSLTGQTHFYWYAHKHVNGRLKRAYLGRSKNLTVQALERASARLHQLSLQGVG